MAMPATAFPESVLASAVLFRAVMDALARPGEVRPLTGAVAPPSPLSATAAALATALLDYETPVWLDAALSAHPQVGNWIRLHTGAHVTADPHEAAFAFIADPERAPDFDAFSLGSPDYPDRSTTLVLQVEGFGIGAPLIVYPAIWILGAMIMMVLGELIPSAFASTRDPPRLPQRRAPVYV